MSGAVSVDRFVRCDPLEVAVGWIYGLEPATDLPRETPAPRAALAAALRPALQAGPCYVTFSGGRDSSAVLAAATALARAEGLEPPVPVTRVYPDIPATDESNWQRRVIDHLGLKDWIRLEYRDGETDLLGEAAQEGVRADGLLWPPAVHTHRAMFSRLGGGSLLTGEGGDAVIGPRRGTALAALRRGRLNPATLRAAVGAALPRPLLERRLVRRAMDTPHSRWLRPAAMARHARRLAADEAQEPLRFDAGTWFLTRPRAFHALVHNHAAVASGFGLRVVEPLLDPGFIAALARWGGAWGPGGRTAMMTALFSDLLPAAVLERTSKAAFNLVYTGPATREFAQSWDGTGVDHDLVDAEQLRAVWLSETPTMSAGVLLHGAWLAAQGAE
jgi:asparagine synthase (glutamine-hydrolysing)